MQKHSLHPTLKRLKDRMSLFMKITWSEKYSCKLHKPQLFHTIRHVAIFQTNIVSCLFLSFPNLCVLELNSHGQSCEVCGCLRLTFCICNFSCTEGDEHNLVYTPRVPKVFLQKVFPEILRVDYCQRQNCDPSVPSSACGKSVYSYLCRYLLD